MPDSSAKRLVQELLAEAGVEVDGPEPWDIQVRDDRLYPRVLKHKNLGLGEAYMDGWWECERIDQLIERLLSADLERKIRSRPGLVLRSLPAMLSNRQTRTRSREVVDRHYDLGNDLFLSFLDDYAMYSCGYFNGCEDVDQAQRNKLAMTCAKLELSPGDRLLDIGSGWGGMARFAAENHGCEVTAVNISGEQNARTREVCADLPVTVAEQDYREVEGEFDKIVSIGMFEHVGPKNYREFMQTAHRCLADDGVFLLHTIGSNLSGDGCDPWIDKYIFPNGVLPSVAQISRAAEGLFVMEDWHNFGPHYDKTLMAWHDRFERAWPELAERYGETFRRMWRYYLLSCAGTFRARAIQLWQIVFTKQGRPQPGCRGELPCVAETAA